MYHEHPPSTRLRRAVACYWTLTAAARGPHRVLPDGCLDLLFDLRGGEVHAVGAMTTAWLDPASERELIGVRFRPGEAAVFLGLPASELTDATVPLADVWRGDTSRRLLDRVQRAATLDARIAVLDEALVARRGARAADWRVRRAVDAILGGGTRVSVVASAVGLGERQLERLFLDRVGIGPKRLARIARLHRVLPHLGAHDLATLAVIGGYVDASHVAREVRALAGTSAGPLAAERAAPGYDRVDNPINVPDGSRTQHSVAP